MQPDRRATKPTKLGDMKPQLIVSDIDGTLIDSNDRISPRLRDVLYRAAHAGAEIALATGRPHRWLYPVLDQLAIRPICVTANGAVLYDSATETILKRYELKPETMAMVLDIARQAIPYKVAVGVERVGTDAQASDEDSYVVTPDFMHTWNPDGFGVDCESGVIGQPAVKMLLRCEDLTAAEMHELVAPLIDPDEAHITYSIKEGLLEVSRPGITKEAGVRALATLHDVPRERIVAFGDMPNDIEMLEWVGLGVAMGNASDEVKEAADEVTATNDQWGVAAILERWF